MRNLLRKNRNFTLLWADQLLSQLSYNMVNFALVILVFQLTQSNLAVGLLMVSFFLPMMFLGVPAGLLSDFYDRRKIMIATDLLWASAVLGFVFIRHNFYFLLLVSFLAKMIDSFFIPAESASLPRVVEKKDLIAANSLFSLTIYISLVIGYSLAGPLMRFFADTAPFIAAASLTTLAAFCVFFMSPPTNKFKKDKEIFPRIVREIKIAWAFLHQKSQIRKVVGIVAISQAIVIFLASLTPGFLEHGLRINAKDASVILVLPIGIGMAAGTFFLGQFQRKIKKRRIIAKGTFLASLSILGLSIGPFLKDYFNQQTNLRYFEQIFGFSGIIAFFAFLLGFSAALLFIPAHTLIQEKTPDSLRGRTYGVLNMTICFLTSILAVLGGSLADKIGAVPIFIFLGIWGVGFSLWQTRA